MATYESFAALSRIIETNNAGHFIDTPIKRTAAFLRQQFIGRADFITSDPVLSRLNPNRIQFRKLAICLAAGVDAATLDTLCM